MLVTLKKISLRLCLIAISLTPVGCSQIGDSTKTGDNSKSAPIFDLNEPVAEVTNIEDAEVTKETQIEEAQSEAPAEEQTQTESLIEEQPQIAEPLPPQDIWERLRQGFQLPQEITVTSVQEQQQRYLRNPRSLNTLFERATPYIFHVTEQLDNAQLPLELALLPIVESNYDPLAYSHSHAVGLWQFIPSTAKSLGLKRTRWYEGRRDIVQSTAAAATYLSYLYKKFDGDWLLALAAYNSGEGAVRKAIKKNRRRGKGTDFWSLKLPRETRNYVPQLLALSNLVRDPESYKIQLPPIANSAYFNIVELPAQIELSKVVEITGVQDALFVQLNPAYRRSVTPPEGTYHILLPIDKSAILSDFLAHNDPSTWADYREYIVKSGDTLSQIAQRHSLPTTLIRRTNGLSNDFLRVGQILRIPPSGELALATEYKSVQVLKYQVVAGDTLSEIAAKHKVSTGNLKRSNNLKNDTIRVGQTLVIKVPSKTAPPTKLRRLSYQVRRGDSLYLIAKRFDLKVSDIASWNRLDREKYLQPGQRLTLYINPLRI